MNANERGLGEIIDEVITLTFKITNHIDSEKAAKRLESLIAYLSKQNLHPDAWNIIALICVNATCWMAQDIVSTEGLKDEDVATYAKIAQDSNKARNALINTINKDVGIVTEKSY